VEAWSATCLAAAVDSECCTVNAECSSAHLLSRCGFGLLLVCTAGFLHSPQPRHLRRSHSTANMNAPHPAEHIVLNEDEKKSAHGVN
jgi:hypothetical protein